MNALDFAKRAAGIAVDIAKIAAASEIRRAIDVVWIPSGEVARFFWKYQQARLEGEERRALIIALTDFAELLAEASAPEELDRGPDPEPTVML